MVLRNQLRLKALEVTNEREYRLMLKDEEDALYPPWFFTWIEDRKFAAFAWPQTRGNLEYLWRNGIRHIITLCPEQIPDLADTNFEWTYFPIEECCAPSIETVFKFIRTIQWCRKRNLPVGVHCRLGIGRTGVMVSVYLMYFQNLEPDQALKNIRYIRPGSVDSYEQEMFVLNYWPLAKIANEKRIRKITRTSDHFLNILKNGGDGRKGTWGLPRCWRIEKKE